MAGASEFRPLKQMPIENNVQNMYYSQIEKVPPQYAAQQRTTAEATTSRLLLQIPMLAAVK